MFEKVNPSHPDKIADRIAGALVDYAYTQENDPRIAVEVLVGHDRCFIITETSVSIPKEVVIRIVYRISRITNVVYAEEPQDSHLSENQSEKVRCGDNGIFRGSPLTIEQRMLSLVARELFDEIGTDGKYILNGGNLIVCQSNASDDEIKRIIPKELQANAIINPLGEWTGGTSVDSGATNRKLGSDMGDAVTGGGLHGKDLSKADVSVNIYAHLLAQKLGKPVEFCCAIGDETVGGVPYEEIVSSAKEYIQKMGGFEKFAEWGLI